MRKFCITVSFYKLPFEENFWYNPQPVTQFSRDQFFTYSTVECIIFGFL